VIFYSPFGKSFQSSNRKAISLLIDRITRGTIIGQHLVDDIFIIFILYLIYEATDYILTAKK